jgi:hypothetical protein
MSAARSEVVGFNDATVTFAEPTLIRIFPLESDDNDCPDPSDACKEFGSLGGPLAYLHSHRTDRCKSGRSPRQFITMNHSVKLKAVCFLESLYRLKS